MVVGHLSRENVIEQIRLAFVWGIRTSSNILLHLGSFDPSYKEFLETIPFWDSKKVFQPSHLMDSEWYESMLTEKEKA